MFYLTLQNPTFLGSHKEQQQDLCLHGEVALKVNDILLSDQGDYCVSIAALRFLRSLFSNHYQGNQEHIIPHCGHFAYFTDDNHQLEFGGCGLGIDFDIIHKDGNILIQTDNNLEIHISFEEYKQAVLSFADQVETFYRKSPERIITDDSDREINEAFWNEWYELKEKAKASQIDTYKHPEVRFDDYISVSDKDVFIVTSHGICLKDGNYISFKDCAINYRNVHGGENNCVGEADATGSVKTLIFYTAPLTTQIHFVPRSKIKEKFTIKNTEYRFRVMKKKIEDSGYSMSI